MMMSPTTTAPPPPQLRTLADAAALPPALRRAHADWLLAASPLVPTDYDEDENDDEIDNDDAAADPLAPRWREMLRMFGPDRPVCSVHSTDVLLVLRTLEFWCVPTMRPNGGGTAPAAPAALRRMLYSPAHPEATVRLPALRELQPAPLSEAVEREWARVARARSVWHCRKHFPESIIPRSCGPDRRREVVPLPCARTVQVAEQLHYVLRLVAEVAADEGGALPADLFEELCGWASDCPEERGRALVLLLSAFRENRVVAGPGRSSSGVSNIFSRGFLDARPLCPGLIDWCAEQMLSADRAAEAADAEAANAVAADDALLAAQRRLWDFEDKLRAASALALNAMWELGDVGLARRCMRVGVLGGERASLAAVDAGLRDLLFSQHHISDGQQPMLRAAQIWDFLRGRPALLELWFENVDASNKALLQKYVGECEAARRMGTISSSFEDEFPVTFFGGLFCGSVATSPADATALTAARARALDAVSCLNISRENFWRRFWSVGGPHALAAAAHADDPDAAMSHLLGAMMNARKRTNVTPLTVLLGAALTIVDVPDAALVALRCALERQLWQEQEQDERDMQEGTQWGGQEQRLAAVADAMWATPLGNVVINTDDVVKYVEERLNGEVHAQTPVETPGCYTTACRRACLLGCRWGPEAGYYTHGIARRAAELGALNEWIHAVRGTTPEQPQI